ncbi:MAG: hypothetical protein D6714_14065 [Bacteroidetes bacterium]|nr:MAG: hypothetical protein D6714_14065 [Bacteroidota bacterium]
MKSVLPIAGLSFLVAFAFSCANIGTLSGGPKDETPPRLDSTLSTPNFQTNFTDRSFHLTYDEWVQLKDVFNQVVVSPPLAYRPKVHLKKKTVFFEFDPKEELREDATYVINFGEAIQDFTEGNVAEMVFVFSTGDFIDSLSVTGKLEDALTGEPIEGMLFMMYENTADSVFRTERPFYFAKSNDEGFFQVNNVKSGTFKGVALIDQNLNYLFDNPTERIAFLDSLFTVSDSVQPNLRLKVFTEEPALFLKDKNTDTYGQVKLAFNRPFYDEVRLTRDSTPLSWFWHEPDRDTLEVWYDLDSLQNWQLFVHRDTLTDTVLVEPKDKSGFLAKAKLRPVKKIKPEIAQKLKPRQPVSLEWNHPLAAFDTSGFFLWEDTLRTRVAPLVEIDSAHLRRLQIRFPWKENRRYELAILPGFVLDRFGVVNADTVRATFLALPEKEFGNIFLKVLDLKPETQYVIRLILDNNLIESTLTRGDSVFQKKYPLLAPGIYTVEVIEDLDQNGRWSTGNYDLRKQPERVFTKTLEELRPNWDVDAEMSATPKAEPVAPPAPPQNQAPPAKIPEGDFNRRINSGKG